MGSLDLATLLPLITVLTGFDGLSSTLFGSLSDSLGVADAVNGA